MREDRDGPDLESVFRRIEPDVCFVDLYVVGDSVQSFQAMRTRLLTRGFRYNVHPVESPVVRFVSAAEIHTQ